MSSQKKTMLELTKGHVARDYKETKTANCNEYEILYQREIMEGSTTIIE